jgi:hypothetical protein
MKKTVTILAALTLAGCSATASDSGTAETYPARCDFMADHIVSDFVPDDLDVWCSGVIDFRDGWRQQSSSDRSEVCESFLTASRSEVLRALEGDRPRDASIGGFDFLWTVC